MTKRRILITGANGGVGTLLSERLRDEYELIRHAHRPDENDPDLLAADLVDYPAVLALMDGVDTVVHMAGAASPESSWDAVLNANIIGVRNALEAAREAGVRRFVFASSNHVMGMYDRDEEWPVYPHMLPRPDSLYGVSKAFGETIGRYYHDEFGLEFIALRIGWISDDPDAGADVDLLRAMWLSYDDTVDVVRSAIEADVTFGLYYAVSDNPHRRWSTTNTRLELGYRPAHDVTRHSSRPENPDEPTPDDWPRNS
ncbi:NAD-dependent epimerase/dehydratase family protein [Tessaracoccus flavus]|uniref:NAD-dependent epimerase n=1 Tax=Tessaracoccus flavus TaxID=1610493 RepID=A0A1Q2CCT5_9ACTN|nr:NAD(P)-dependent oxidoreductase [Tessaracoccus flavus]AQP43932.1 NAD-dependent epimerase [Tessaracoccus flavus]SDY29082.1 uronate dehydrogenase [Tessaracoccus flavus]